MKTVGTKLDNSEYEEFEEYCNENGLTKSEQLRTLIKNYGNEKLSNSDSEPFKDCTDCDEEVHNHLKEIINKLHESEGATTRFDDDGRIIEYSTYWVYDKD